MGSPSVLPAADGDERARGVYAIAVDGLSGSGKSTVSRALAKRLGWAYLDTGACYRALTVAALDGALVDVGAERPPTHGLEQLAAAALSTLEVSLDPDVWSVRLAGVDVTARIRDDATTLTVSAVSADPKVRARAVAWQRDRLRSAHGCVVEGRDIGTVVLPNAPLKVWLTAAAEERAERRAGEQQVADRRTTRGDLERRDRLDRARTTDPAVPASDAVLIDTTELAVEQVVGCLVDLAVARGLTKIAS